VKESASQLAGESLEAWAQEQEHEGERLALTPEDLGLRITYLASVPMIEAHGLVKRYGATVAVNDLSFSIRPGLVTGFLGPNGAGKTTTMRMILGLDAPT
jgi:ABC-type glutathione transport system ATPase component